MSERDQDLELKRLELRRMRRLLSTAQRKDPTATTDEDPVNFIKAHLEERGEEVLSAAIEQYPNEAKEVAKLLMNLIKSGKLEEKISGPILYSVFRRSGVNVKLNTKIAYLKRGELKSLSELFKGE